MAQIHSLTHTLGVTASLKSDSSSNKIDVISTKDQKSNAKCIEYSLIYQRSMSIYAQTGQYFR